MTHRCLPWLVASLLALSACGQDSEPEETTTDDSDCGLEQDGVTTCNGSVLNRCHATTEDDGHFHRHDCGEAGYTCVQVDDRTGTCADETVTCTDGEAICSDDGMAAGTCVDGLLWIEECETGTACVVEGGAASCALPSTETSTDWFEPDEVEASVFASGEDTVWLLTAKQGKTWLSIENYTAYGGATGPETRTLDAVDIDYATCGLCLLLQTDCEPHGDHAHCGATFMPEVGGEVVTEALDDVAGGSWTGQLSEIRFVEVEIGSDFQTTVVEGGDSFFLGDWSFDTVLEGG